MWVGGGPDDALAGKTGICVCVFAHVCVTFLAIWSLYVPLLLVCVFFLLNHHQLIYRYNHHICASGAFILVDGWKTPQVQTLPWTVPRCPQVMVTVPPHSTHRMHLKQPGQYRPQNSLQISKCAITECTCINNAHGFTLADLQYCGVSPMHGHVLHGLAME